MKEEEEDGISFESFSKYLEEFQINEMDKVFSLFAKFDIDEDLTISSED